MASEGLVCSQVRHSECPQGCVPFGLLFSRYFFLPTKPDEGLSPKRRIIKIFSLNLHISHLEH